MLKKILNRFQPHPEEIVADAEEQAGVRAGRGTIEHLFSFERKTPSTSARSLSYLYRLQEELRKKKRLEDSLKNWTGLSFVIRK